MRPPIEEPWYVTMSKLDFLPPQGNTQPLSAQEKIVLHHIAHGMKYPEIADAMQLSPHTVGFYVKKIMIKTGAHDRAAITHHAIDQGLTNKPNRAQIDLRVAEYATLSAREREAMNYMAIAPDLNAAAAWVGTSRWNCQDYEKAIYKKMALSGRAELVQAWRMLRAEAGRIMADPVLQRLNEEMSAWSNDVTKQATHRKAADLRPRLLLEPDELAPHIAHYLQLPAKARTVLSLYATGAPIFRIANALQVSEETVNKQLTSIAQTMGSSVRDLTVIWASLRHKAERIAASYRALSDGEVVAMPAHVEASATIESAQHDGMMHPRTIEPGVQL